MLITRTAPPILDISLGTALTVDTLPVDEDFGLMPVSGEWEDGEDHDMPLPPGVDMDKVKDIIGQLYEKGAV